MNGLLFFLGCTLVALAMGVPDDLPTHSGGVRSALPYLAYWLVSPLQDFGGKYLVVAFGVALLIWSFVLPKKIKK